jgi:hypothetical protein
MQADHRPPFSRWLPDLAEAVILCGIMLIAVYFRWVNLADNPGWYTDETTHIDIAQHLLEGDMRYMVIQESTLLFGRLPLFHIVLSSVFQAAPGAESIWLLRLLTGGLGSLSVLLLFGVGRRSGGRLLGLSAALFLAIYPQAILYSRIGFSYNLLTPLILMLLMALDRYLARPSPHWLLLAGLMAGLGLLTEVWMLSMILPLLLCAAYRPHSSVWVLPLLLLPGLIYVVYMMLHAPAAFQFDLMFTLSRLGSGKSLADQWGTFTNNIYQLATGNSWMLLGGLGLFTLPQNRLRWLSVLFLVIPLLAVGRTNALYSLSAYYLIPLMPLAALGTATLLQAGIHMAYRILSQWPKEIHDQMRYQNTIWAPLRVVDHGNVSAHGLDQFLPLPTVPRKIGAVATTITLSLLFAALPLFRSVTETIASVRTGYTTDIDAFLVNAQEARQVADFINSRVATEDIVIASPSVAWQFRAQTADFQMAIAITDRVETPHLPADIPAERLAFNPDYRLARYVVVDNLWRNWGLIHIPGLSIMTADIESTWETVFTLGQFSVYRNPR